MASALYVLVKTATVHLYSCTIFIVKKNLPHVHSSGIREVMSRVSNTRYVSTILII